MLEDWVSSITALPGIEWIGVEGGEPFAAPAQLEVILRIAKERGVSTSVLTNAYWAKDERRAREVLKKYPKIDFLIISADEFHEEYIPLSSVVTALRAARDHVERLGVQICTGPIESIDIIKTPLQYIGRAQETDIMNQPEVSTQLPEAICHFLGTPVLREDGILVACCQQDAVLSRQRNLFQLGNLIDYDAEELMARVESDIYFQTLRVFGPKKIAKMAMSNSWGWEPKAYQRGNVCELCMHLASNPKVVDGFRETFDTPQYRAALKVGRSILFDESKPEEILEQEFV
jgi:hypothetical protein